MNAYKIGETVKILKGTYASFSGKITEIDQKKDKVKVKIFVASREMEIELASSEISHK